MTSDKTFAEVRRRFAASPEKIFSAFGDADLVERWLTPSPEIKLTILQFDFRVGGRYRFAYHVPDAATVTIGGAFQSIEPPTRIVLSWIIEPPDEHAGIESEVTVTITPGQDSSELVIRHEKLKRTDAVTRHTDGWRGALDQLAELLKAKGVGI